MYVNIVSPNLAGCCMCTTPAIGRIVIATDAPKVRLSLAADGVEFYAVTLYAYSGRVWADDIASVIELHFIRKDWFCHNVVFTAATIEDNPVTSSMTVLCLFCSYDIPDDHDFSKSFYTCLQTQRVPPASKLRIYGPMAAGDDVAFRVSGRTADGSLTSCELAAGAADFFVDADIPMIEQRCRAASDLVKADTISIFCGDMVKTLFVVNMPDFLEFRFRNCFNCPESLFIAGSVVMKTEVTRDEAVCAGKIQQYNHLTTRSYECETGPLTRQEAAAMSQLVESRSVSVVVDGKEYPVIISDHTCDVKNDCRTLNTMKFTWRFSGKRPRLFGDSLSPLLESYGIFTREFEEPYQ